MDSEMKFNTAIQLEEITHFQRKDLPTRSILSTHKKFRKKIPKKVSYEALNEKQLRHQVSSEGTEDTSSIAGSSNPNKEAPSPLANSYGDVYGNDSDFSEESSSDVEASSDCGIYDDDGDDYSARELDRPAEGGGPGPGYSNTVKGGLTGGGGDLSGAISDENLFPIPSIQVTRVDLVFSLISFLTNCGELVMDLVLVVWHYQNDQKWASGLTMAFISSGGIGLLYQFGVLQQGHLDRLFRRGKRVRILVSSFPPAATLIVSYSSTMTAWKAIKDPMVSQQYFKLNEFLLSLSRVQSFFQAAPQATLQLVILLENFHQTSWEKALFTLTSILISITVMTNANLPSKSDTPEGSSPNKAAYIPLSRIFMGLRMFSSLGSRTMALAYLVIGCRCLLQPDSSLFESTMVAVILTIFPRLVFTLTDYFAGLKVRKRNLERYREQPELGVSSSHPIEKLPLGQLFLGYLATVFFPVGDPLWLFWYLWCESGIFVIFGNVAGTVAEDCLDSSVDGIYTGVFLIVFIIVPVVVPYVRAVVQRYKIQRFMRVLQVVEDQDGIEDSLEVGRGGGADDLSVGSNRGQGTKEFSEGFGINDNPNYDPGICSSDNSHGSTNYSGNVLRGLGGGVSMA